MATKKYDCSVNVYIDRGINYESLSLCPADYLCFDTEEEVREAIIEDLDCSLNYGNVEVQEAITDYDIPEEFFIKWNELKKSLNEIN